MSFVDHDKEIQIIVPTKKKIKNKKQQQKTTNKQTNKQTNMSKQIEKVWFMVFSAAFNFQLYHGGQFYWWRKTGYTTDELYRIMLYRVHLA